MPNCCIIFGGVPHFINVPDRYVVGEVGLGLVEQGSFSGGNIADEMYDHPNSFLKSAMIKTNTSPARAVLRPSEPRRWYEFMLQMY